MTLTPMMQQYTRIKAQYPDALVFFRLGDFYELFGEDAEIASKVLEIALTSRDRRKKNPLPMCGVPHHAASGYLEKLVKSGFKVAICEQLEDPRTAKGVVKRDVIRVITPGTYLEGDVEDKSNVYLIGIAKKSEQYALAAVDLSTGEFKVTLVESANEMKDELTRIQPAEIIVSAAGTLDDLELDQLTNQINTTITKTDARNWFPQTCEHLLTTHFKLKSLSSHGLDNELLIQTAGAVLAYLQETQMAALEHITQIIRYSLTQFLQIDGISQRNLELTKTIRDGRKVGSLLGVLDQSVTSMGGRLLRSWIEKPLINPIKIRNRQQAISCLVNDSLLRLELVELLDNIQDLERLLSKLVYGSGNARDLIALKISLEQIPKIRKLLTARDSNLSIYADQLDLLDDLTDMINRGIADDPPVSVREGNLIKNGFNQELDQLRTAKKDGKAWIASLEAQERERTGIRSLKVGFNRVFGYYLEVTKANIANAERFTTPELKEKEALILGAEERITDLEYRLFTDIRTEVSKYIVQIQQNARVVAVLDVFQALAKVARDQNYVCPEITDETTLTIIGGRHPVIEALQPGFVPNDLHFTEENRLVLLTGPNMAGKSTFLRQTALIVILAQIGSFVPATDAKIGIVDKIFTRIGAADDLSTGQSTFMVECSETANLIRHATKSSLVILDELGRGTSTFDGMAIAQAVIEYIHNKINARTLFSTHYHELTKLEETLKRLQTYQMAIEESAGRIYFLYKVISGNTDRSYGINVAKMAGMPSKIIDRAETLLYQLEANQKKPVQLDLFQSLQHPLTAVALEQERYDNEMLLKIKAELLKINVNEITPLNALEIVDHLQQLLSGGGGDDE